MSIYEKYNDYAVSQLNTIVGRKGGYITQAEREKGRKQEKRIVKRNRTMSKEKYISWSNMSEEEKAVFKCEPFKIKKI